jgi:hypothetical protein
MATFRLTICERARRSHSTTALTNLGSKATSSGQNSLSIGNPDRLAPPGTGFGSGCSVIAIVTQCGIASENVSMANAVLVPGTISTDIASISVTKSSTRINNCSGGCADEERSKTHSLFLEGTRKKLTYSSERPMKSNQTLTSGVTSFYRSESRFLGDW